MCFFIIVQGCDASNLLVGPNTERNSSKNAGMGGGAYELIDRIKKVLEIRCPRAVSCTDILSLATRDAVHFVTSLSFLQIILIDIS